MSEWDQFPKTLDLIEKGRESHQHHGVQIYVSKRGDPLLDAAWGDEGNEESLSPDKIMLWLSAGKPLTAVALGVLHDRGQLDWEDSLSVYFPEWAMFGQPDITLAQILKHTAGVQNQDLAWPESEWSEIISNVLENPLPDDWPPGQKAGYVVAASWFLLGEIVARLTSESFSSALRTLVLQPLQMKNTYCGMGNEEYSAVQSNLGKVFGRTPRGLQDLNWDQEVRVVSPAPGGNCRGPIRELGLFYESLLPNSATQILREETTKALTSRQRTGMYDETFRHKIDWGYGFIVNSNCYGAETVPYGFGRYASESAFGHGGSQSAMGFADPYHDLVVTWVANGRIGEPRHHDRNRAINEAIYEDLGLTSETK